jgi:hypothetical protein
MLWTSDKDLSYDDDEDSSLAHIRWIANLWMPRSCGTYKYAGEFINAIDATCANLSKNWNRLPQFEQDRRWVDNFWTLQHDFDELYDLVEPPLVDRRCGMQGMRPYIKQTQLLVTLHFLAHCNTLHVVAEMFDFPHNSISACCIHPSITALCHVFILDQDTMNIRWPYMSDEIYTIANDFQRSYRLPGGGD